MLRKRIVLNNIKILKRTMLLGKHMQLCFFLQELLGTGNGRRRVLLRGKCRKLLKWLEAYLGSLPESNGKIYREDIFR